MKTFEQVTADPIPNAKLETVIVLTQQEARELHEVITFVATFDPKDKNSNHKKVKRFAKKLQQEADHWPIY